MFPDKADQAPQTTERRWTERVAMEVPIAIRRQGNPRKAATLADLSPFGCSLKNIVNLRVGETLWVALPGLESQPAQIRWAGLGNAGVAFDTPLHSAVMERICGQYSAAGAPETSPARATPPAGQGLSRRERILAGIVNG